MIVHFNGLPGTGKLTVAKALLGLLQKNKISCRLVDNHLIYNIPIALCRHDTPEYWDLFRKVRDVTYGALAALPPETVIVMTNALAQGLPSNAEQWQALQALAAQRGDGFNPVLLTCDLPALQARIGNRDRYENRKLTDAAQVAHYHKTVELIHPASAPVFNTTHDSPQTVAQKVFDTVMGG